MTRRHVYALLLMLSVGACKGAASKTAESSPSDVISVASLTPNNHHWSLATVSQHALGGTVPATGKVMIIPDQEARVTPRQSGRVMAVYRTRGDSVHAGEALAQIESPELAQAQSDYLQAEAKHALSQSTLQRQHALFAKGLSARKELIVAETDSRATAIDLEKASNQLRLQGFVDGQIASLARRRTISPSIPIIAPITGRITARNLTLGEMITPANPVFTISDMRTMWAVIDVHEKDLGRVKAGTPVDLTFTAYPDRHFHSQIVGLGDVLDKDSHTAKAKIRLDNAAGLFKSEMAVTATLQGIPTARALAVPAESVVRDGGQDVVYVAKGPGQFQRRPVVVGAEEDGFVPVKTGLVDGERIVAKGSLFLSGGH
jgi:cobalt-zinc-cadmium efflux system membrane fusion protein